MADTPTKACPWCGATNWDHALTCVFCKVAIPNEEDLSSLGDEVENDGQGMATSSSMTASEPENPYGTFEHVDLGQPLAVFSMSRALSLTFLTWFKNAPMVLLSTVLAFLPLYLYFCVRDEASLVRLNNLDVKWVVGYVALAQAIIAVLLAHSIFQSLNGKKVSLWTGLGKGLLSLAPSLPIVVVFGAVIGMTSMFVGWLSLVVSCTLFVCVPAYVIERPGIVGAMGRSKDLTEGHKWSIFGLLVMLFLVNYGARLLVEVSLGELFSEQSLANLSMTAVLLRVNVAVVALITAEGVLASVVSVTTLVVYYLLRQSKEGTSAKDLARVFQ